MENGGPSVTARRVAAHRLAFDRAAADYGDPAADEALAADVAAGQAAPANRMHDYLAARTAFFDRTVVAAIDRGVRQVVVGAAAVLARTGWQVMPRRDETPARRERLRSAGLLIATAGPAAPRASVPPSLSEHETRDGSTR
jgi:hypothetical protein